MHHRAFNSRASSVTHFIFATNRTTTMSTQENFQFVFPFSFEFPVAPTRTTDYDTKTLSTTPTKKNWEDFTKFADRKSKCKAYLRMDWNPAVKLNADVWSRATHRIKNQTTILYFTFYRLNATRHDTIRQALVRVIRYSNSVGRLNRFESCAVFLYSNVRRRFGTMTKCTIYLRFFVILADASLLLPL